MFQNSYIYSNASGGIKSKFLAKSSVPKEGTEDLIIAQKTWLIDNGMYIWMCKNMLFYHEIALIYSFISVVRFH